MKSIDVRFVLDDSLDYIDVLIRSSKNDEQVKDIIEKITQPEDDCVAVIGAKGSLDLIPAGDIIMLSVNGKEVNVITENSRHTAKQSLSRIESIIDPDKFIRISRYEIINLAKVVRYDFTFSGTLRIELAGGIETWASRRSIPLIRKRLIGKE